jgi:CO/xanthine dehydrogenase FAD-binding subunit
LKAAPFDYVRAASIEEACECLRRDGEDSKLIAGGQSLVPMMAMRLTRPARLVDINEIAALKFIALEDGVARIGACTRQSVVACDDALAAHVPLLRRALAWVGHAQTRNRGTLGGSLAHADPTAELPLAAQVLGASLTLRSASGARTVPAAEFFLGPLTTALTPHECLEEIHWPVWMERAGCAFTEVSRRHGDFAIVEACAQIALDDDGRCTRATFGLGGGGTKAMAFPVLAARLIETRLDDELTRSVAHDAAAELDPGSDLHASAAYRRHLASVLAARVLREAYAEAARMVRAGGSGAVGEAVAEPTAHRNQEKS